MSGYEGDDGVSNRLKNLQGESTKKS